MEQWQTLSSWFPKSLWMVTAAMELKEVAPWKKSNDKPRQHIKKQRQYFDSRDLYSKSCGFSSSHVWMWKLDNKKGWTPKNSYLWTVVLEKILESPLHSEEIKPVSLKGSQLWIFTERTDAKAEAPILWPLDVESQLVGKDPDAGKDWRQEEKGMTDDEMVGCHHWLNGHELEQTPGDGEGQRSLEWYNPWGHKELNITEWLNNNHPTW